MLPSEDFGIVPKFGLEIEVVKWTRRTRAQVCQELVDAELMSANGNFVREFHRYHCDCNVCMAWMKGKVPWPIQTIQQYDASLPDTGGEFITSPMLCTDLFLDGLEQVWRTVVTDAEWRTDIPNRRGGPSSPSVHVHVSVENPFKNNFNGQRAREALWTFLPELFKIASVCGLDRGLEYRSPNMSAGHHSAINLVHMNEDRDTDDIATPVNTLRAVRPARRRDGNNNAIRLEWRMWEAAYDDWEYIKGAVALSAAMTQLVANRDMAKVLSTGATLLDDGDYDVEEADVTAEVLELFSPAKFNFLHESVLTAPLVQEDPAIYETLNNLFDRVKEQ